MSNSPDKMTDDERIFIAGAIFAIAVTQNCAGLAAQPSAAALFEFLRSYELIGGDIGHNFALRVFEEWQKLDAEWKQRERTQVHFE